jgi:hypothetical protein
MHAQLQLDIHISMDFFKTQHFFVSKFFNLFKFLLHRFIVNAKFTPKLLADYRQQLILRVNLQE